MKVEIHLQAFEERKETIFKWGIDVRGIENSQRIIGDNASKAIIDLLSAYLHKNNLVDIGFQLNHSWFKSDKVSDRIPEFSKKSLIVKNMVELENICEKLSYGAPKSVSQLVVVINLFNKIEEILQELLK